MKLDKSDLCGLHGSSARVLLEGNYSGTVFPKNGCCWVSCLLTEATEGHAACNDDQAAVSRAFEFSGTAGTVC